MTRRREHRLERIGLACVFGLVASLAACETAPPKDPPPGNRVFSPSWYDETPADEDGTIFETAQAVGATVTMSENMAINQARQNMALTIETRVDVMQRTFSEQVDLSGEPNLLRRFQNVNETIASQTLKGSNVIRKETYPENLGGFRTFVLMELDAGMIEMMYLDQLRAIEELEVRLRSSEAWSELERKAEQLRRERNSRGMPPMTDSEIRGDG